jgi:hypothetical protein
MAESMLRRRMWYGKVLPWVRFGAATWARTISFTILHFICVLVFFRSSFASTGLLGVGVGIAGSHTAVAVRGETVTLIMARDKKKVGGGGGVRKH